MLDEELPSGSQEEDQEGVSTAKSRLTNRQLCRPDYFYDLEDTGELLDCEDQENEAADDKVSEPVVSFQTQRRNLTNKNYTVY